jgi:hypothetical protein
MVTADRSCEYWQGMLAVDAIGQLDDAGRVELHAHVEECVQCQIDQIELSDAMAALAFVDGATMGDPRESAVPFGREVRPAAEDGAGPSIRSDVGTSAVVGRPAIAWATAAVAAAVIVLVVALGMTGHAPAGARTVVLHGPRGSHATALLVPETWGTRIELTDHGTWPRRDLTVSMGTEYGRRWIAGSYRSAAAGDLTVTLGCALPISQISSIAVTEAGGQVVLHS